MVFLLGLWWNPGEFASRHLTSNRCMDLFYGSWNARNVTLCIAGLQLLWKPGMPTLVWWLLVVVSSADAMMMVRGSSCIWMAAVKHCVKHFRIDREDEWTSHWQTLCILACLQTNFEHISSEGDPQRLFMKAMAMLTHLGKSLQLCNEHSPHASTLHNICHIVILRVTLKLNWRDLRQAASAILLGDMCRWNFLLVSCPGIPSLSFSL